MIKPILADNVSTVAKTLTGKLSSFDADGLLFDVVVGGTAFARTKFDSVIINATFRTAEGDDINIIKGVRLGDFLKMSDNAGGLSMALQGDVNGKFSAYVPLGNLMLSGDDVIDIEMRFPADPNTTYDVRVSATDLIKMNEVVNGYESFDGNGSETLIKNARSVYLVSAPTGATISVQDQERSYFVSDRDVVALGLAIGRSEKYDDIGTIYSDGTGMSQNVRVKAPTGSKLLVQTAFFPIKRINRKAEAAQVKLTAIAEDIRLADPDKYAVLRAYGLIG